MRRCGGALAAALCLLWLNAATAQDAAPLREARASIASTELQNQVRPRVIAAANERFGEPACRTITIAETAFNGWTGAPIPAAVAPTKPWEETWIVDLCGRIADVLVQFSPGPDGIAAEIPARSVHMRP